WYISHRFFLLLLAVYVVYKSFRLDDLLHKFRESLSFEFGAFCKIVDHAGIKIHLHFIAVLDPFACRRAFDDREPDIDGIAVKNPCESLRDHTAHPRRLDGDGRMLPGGAAAEILV